MANQEVLRPVAERLLDELRRERAEEVEQERRLLAALRGGKQVTWEVDWGERPAKGGE